MKALRLAGIVLGVLLALLAIGVGLLYALFDGEKIKAELSSMVLEQKQRKLDIAGKLELSIWPDIGIRLGRATLSEPGGKEEFLALDSARVAVALVPLLSKQVQVRRVDIQGFKATLLRRRDGTLNIDDLTGGAPGKPAAAGGTAAPAPLQIDIAGIKVANAALTWRDEKNGSTTTLSNLDLATGRIKADGASQTMAIDALSLGAKGKHGPDAFELKLEVPKLVVSPDKATGESLSLAANLAGSGRQVAARIQLSGVAGDARTLKIARLALDLDAKSAETLLKAHFDSPVAVNIAARTLALEQIAGSADVENPRLPMKQVKLPLAGSLRADLARHTAALALETRFDESKIALELDVGSFSPLALGFDLDIDTLDLDKYLPPKAAGDKTATETRLDFSALKGPDLHGAIRVGALQVSRFKVTRLNARLKLANGRLDIAPLTLRLYDGSTNGSLSFDAAGNRVAIDQNLVGVSINPLMKDLADKDLLEGRGSMVLDLRSHGDSVTAMKKALAGSALVSLQDGAIKGINLAQSLRELKARFGAASGKREASTQQANARDKTDFSELTASLKIVDGVAHNDDLAMKSPFLRVSGAGDIDIGAGSMSYLAKASVVASSAGQGGKGLEHLRGLTVPVRVTGPFENLSYKIELGSLVEDAAKAKLEEKKQEIKAKVGDQLKDKLKGLFGR